MFNTFMHELKRVFKSKRRIIELIIIIFIPFVYGFLYLNAFWSPFSNVDQLKIAVVNLDENTGAAKELSSDIHNTDKFTVGSFEYSYNVDELYQPNNSLEETKEKVANGDYHAIIAIPSGFNDAISTFRNELIGKTLSDILDLSNNEVDLKYVSSLIDDFNEKNVWFFNSYKHSYLAGEMTNFGAALQATSFSILKSSITSIDPSISEVVSLISREHHINDEALSIIEHRPIGDNINTYGFGMVPYFLSIALWAGALVSNFLIKNKRYIKTENTIKHLLGKAFAFMLIGVAQSLLLLIAYTIQGVNIGMMQWDLFVFGIIVSLIFQITIQNIMFAFRYSDFAEFIIVILLVLQLVSSSGTFPSSMQIPFFGFISHILPFTYSIDLFRELMFDTNWSTVFANLGILMIFPIVTFMITFYFNYMFDKKNAKITDGSKTYHSYEIEIGDH